MESFSKLRSMTDDEIIAVYDLNAQLNAPGPLPYLQELARRDQDRQTRAMLKYTRWITVMTVIMTLATIVNIYVSYHR